MARFSLFSASTCKLDSVRTTATPTSGSNQIPSGNQRIKKASEIADHLYSWLGRLDDIVYFRLVLGINSCEQALITEPATITIKMVSRLCASLVSKPRKYPPA